MRIACHCATISFIAILAVTYCFCQEVDTSRTGPIDFTWGVKIPMRDGVKLNATLYRPKTGEKLPAIFTFTPYIADSYHNRAYYFSRNGYVFLLIDVRGRGNSEGTFEPFSHEGQDGYDVVEWIARQPWCNGKVTMWGGSYAGFDQWSTLKEFPPHLASLVPVASAHLGVDFPARNNIPNSYQMQWLTYTSGRTWNGNLFGESRFWIAKFTEYYLQHRPYKELDKIVGNESTHFQTWLAHPAPDAYWDAMAPTPENYKQINIPILTITGDYDGDQLGALTYYKHHMEYGTPEARQQHYLVIGPWDHAGTRTPQKSFGGLEFGPASLLDMNQLHKEWYDWTLKAGKKPEFLKKRVAYYVAGSEEWKYADNLDSIGATKYLLFLNSSGSANDVFSSGSLIGHAPQSGRPDKYVYDPLETRPATLDSAFTELAPYLRDQRNVLNLFGNGVIYHSEPLATAVQVAGSPKFTVWLSLDVPDTDFNVALYEILCDGSSILLTSDMMRARYRESLREAKLVTPGEVNKYEFKRFPWFSRRLAKGSRLRLVLNCVNTIYYEKNYNSGGDVASETAKDARTAHITVYHSEKYPSQIELPTDSKSLTAALGQQRAASR